MSTTAPQVGEIYNWNGEVQVEVLRVLRGGKAAAIRATSLATGTTWEKRQPIPFPESMVAVNRPKDSA